MATKSKYQKVGVRTTLDLLSNSNGGLKKSVFYKQFNMIHYYNAFLRIKDYMLKNKLITIQDSVISITEKGLKALDLMNYLQEFIEG